MQAPLMLRLDWRITVSPNWRSEIMEEVGQIFEVVKFFSQIKYFFHCDIVFIFCLI